MTNPRIDPPKLPAEQSRQIVVIGGGTMGAGIGQSLLRIGHSVTIVEADEKAADAARERVEAGLQRQHRRAEDRNLLVAADLAGLSVTTAYRAAPEVTHVIEAVPELVAVKSQVLARASACWPQAVLATNTSALSLDVLARSVAQPDRFVGMHFFNPVPRSALVEIVVGQRTSAATVASARALVTQLGKESIQVRDVPGFATSRLGLALGLEAIRMVEEGVASVQDIDKGMRLGYRFPMGPLELTDLVGLDVRLSVAEYLAREFGARFEPPSLLREMVGRGELGSKTGRGFYTWKNGHR